MEADLISRISGDPALREALRSQLGMSPASTEDLHSHVSGTNTSVSSQSASGSSTSSNISVSTAVDQQSGAADTPPVDENHQSSSNDSPLVARVHQLGANINDPLAARVHQSEVNDAMNPNGGHQIDNDNSAGPSDFDPARYTTDYEYTFDAQSAITSYIEKHFRSTLDKTSRSAMHKEHPVPKTPATKVPKVDSFVTEYLKSNFPKSEDAELSKVQSALLKVCGPMACMWAELIDNNLLSAGIPTLK